MNTQLQKRPAFADYIGEPGAFIEAMRQFRGLGYRKFAQAVQEQVRGKERRGSENYLYRLCQGQARLKPAMVDGISRALELTAVEHKFLQRAASSKASQANDLTQKGKQLLRLLASSTQEQLRADLARALIDPLVLATYTLAGRGDLTSEQLLKLLCKGSSQKISKPQARAALELLLATGILLQTTDNLIKQSQPGNDLAIFTNATLGDSVKSEAMKLFYGALDAWGSQAIFNVPRQQRRFLSTTFLVKDQQLAELNQELEQAWQELIAKLRTKYESANGNVVMHAGLRAWPLLNALAQIQQEGADHANT